MPLWLWFGNLDTQINAVPSTGLTGHVGNGGGGVAYNGLNGVYNARDGMELVDISGTIVGGSYQTTYNPTYGINGSGAGDAPPNYGGTRMSYTSPDSDVGVESDARMTLIIRVNITVTEWQDGVGGAPGGYVFHTLDATVVQMDNGDIFLRPLAGTYAPGQIWDGVEKFVSFEINSAVTIDNDTAVNPVPGFNGEWHDFEFICYARDTMILTTRGEVAVQDLVAGDSVVTCDHGPQPLAWIGSSRLSALALRRRPRLAPVRIEAGALGQGLPVRALEVSPQHRILVRSPIAERMFGAPEVLVAAVQLCGLSGVAPVEEATGVEYFHLLFRDHEVVFANGAEAESLYTGPQAVRMIHAAGLAEIFELFPELRQAHRPLQAAARPLVPGRKARRLVERHSRHGLPLVCMAGKAPDGRIGTF